MQFNLTGIVRGFGDSESRNLRSIDLSYDILAGNFNNGFSQQGIIQTQGNDSFTVVIDVPDNKIQFLGPRCMLRIIIRAFVPASRRRDFIFTTSLEGSGQEILDQIVDFSQDLVIEIDVSDTQIINFEIFIKDDADELENIDTLALALISNPNGGNRIASITARRTDNKFTGTLICDKEEIDRSGTWLMMYDRIATPPNNIILREQDIGRVFLRTRTHNNLQELINAENLILISQVESSTGVGTLSDSLPEQITEGMLIIRDLDLDFINGKIRVKGRVGIGGWDFQLFEIGEFEVVLSLAIIESRNLRPFGNHEINNPFEVKIDRKTFDVLPGTDLDELPFGIGITMIESFIGGVVADTIKDRIKSEIRKELNKKVDEVFEEIASKLSFSSDPEGLTREIRDTLFIQMDNINVDSNNVSTLSFAGVWHPLVSFQNLDCPANTASIVFSVKKPRNTFLKYKYALSKKNLEPWMKLFKTHSPELSKIVLKDPSTTAQLISLFQDLEPVLNEKSNAGLSENGVKRFLDLSQIIKKQSSNELSIVIDKVNDIFKKGIGCGYSELLRLAENGIIASEKPTKKVIDKKRKSNLKINSKKK